MQLVIRDTLSNVDSYDPIKKYSVRYLEENYYFAEI
jgi:hypothetical protein